MARCRSWVPVDVTVDQGRPSRPGWRPCRNKVARGVARCDECWIILATHPDPLVRRGLATEENLPTEIIELLQQDSDPEVQRLANSYAGTDNQQTVDIDNEEEVDDPWD